MIWIFGILMSAAVVVVFALINAATRGSGGMDLMTASAVAILAVATLATIVTLLVIA